jgi:hypothetical protein
MAGGILRKGESIPNELHIRGSATSLPGEYLVDYKVRREAPMPEP